MRAADFLSSLTKPRVADIARGFDVAPERLDKDALVSRVAKSLAAQYGGWEAALGQLLPELNKDELLNYLYELYWEGDEQDCIYALGSRARTLPAAEVRELAECLSLADEREEAVEDVITSPRWSAWFDRFADDDELPTVALGEGEEEEPEPEGLLEREPWAEKLVYETGPGVPLPEGLQPVQRPLHPHQERSFRALGAWYDGAQQAGVLTLPTGAGKTRTAVAFLLARAVADRKRVLWLTHRQELVDQAVRSMVEGGHEAPRRFFVSRFEAGRRKYENPTDVVVASIPTLTHGRGLPNFRRLQKTQGGFDLVVVDECHHGVARSWRKLLRELQDKSKKVLGLSATPTRTSVREVPEFWSLFGSIIHQEKPLPLMKEGVLARPRIFIVSTGGTYQADANEQRWFQQFHDLPRGLVERIASDSARNRLIMSTYVERKAEWGQTLLFAASINHAKELKRQAVIFNLKAVEIDSRSPPAARKAAIEAFRRKEVQLLINVALFTEGTDLPEVETVFVARPTRSGILFQQMVGRGLRGRQMGGTDSCNVVSFYDNVLGLMQDQLTSNFSQEQEALEALGLGAEEEDDRRAPPAPAPTPAASPIERRIREVLAALEQGALSSDRLGNVLQGVLVGWWEVHLKGRSAVLIVVLEDALRIEEEVKKIVALSKTSPSGTQQVQAVEAGWHRLEAAKAWLLREHWVNFCQLVLAGGSSGGYRSLDEATPENWRALQSALQASPAGEPAGMPSQATASIQAPIQVMKPVASAAPAPLPTSGIAPGVPSPAGATARPASARPQQAQPTSLNLPSGPTRVLVQLARAMQGLAREGRVLPPGAQLVQAGGEALLVSQEQWTAVLAAVEKLKGFGPAWSQNEHALEFGQMALAASGKSDEVTTRLLRHAVEQGGELSASALPATPPSLEEYAREVRGLGEAEARDAIRAGFEAFFMELYASREDYLEAFLLARLRT